MSNKYTAYFIKILKSDTYVIVSNLKKLITMNDFNNNS